MNLLSFVKKHILKNTFELVEKKYWTWGELFPFFLFLLQCFQFIFIAYFFPKGSSSLVMMFLFHWSSVALFILDLIRPLKLSTAVFWRISNFILFLPLWFISFVSAAIVVVFLLELFSICELCEYKLKTWRSDL